MPTIADGAIGKLGEFIKSFKPDLIILDTYGAFANASDETYKKEYAAMSLIKEVCDQGSTDCLLVHHARKRTEFDKGNPVERLLGSQALSGVADNVIVLDREGAVVTLFTQGRLVDDSVVTLKIENGQIYEVDSGLETLQHKAPAQAAVIDIIKEHPSISRQKQLVEMSGLPQSQVSQIEKSLKKQGRITGGRGEPYQYLGDAI